MKKINIYLIILLSSPLFFLKVPNFDQIEGLRSITYFLSVFSFCFSLFFIIKDSRKLTQERDFNELAKEIKNMNYIDFNHMLDDSNELLESNFKLYKGSICLFLLIISLVNTWSYVLNPISIMVIHFTIHNFLKYYIKKINPFIENSELTNL